MINESFLNVLMYVFENYVEDNIKLKKPQEIINKMIQEGFGQEQAHQAIDWFNVLAKQQDAANTFYQDKRPDSFRVYSHYEQHKITEEARQFLTDLESGGLIDAHLHEVILHQALVMDEPLIELAEIQWITLMSLYGIPEKKPQLAALEDYILFEKEGSAH